eukprot:gene5534-6893_t
MTNGNPSVGIKVDPKNSSCISELALIGWNGMLPNDLSTLTGLRLLTIVGGGSLTGTIPSVLPQSLEYLGIFNSNFEGSVPSIDTPCLTKIEIVNNTLSGNLPQFLISPYLFGTAQQFYGHIGSIPKNIFHILFDDKGKLRTQVDLSGNRLTDGFSNSVYCVSRNQSILNLNGNNFSNQYTKCSPSISFNSEQEINTDIMAKPILFTLQVNDPDFDQFGGVQVQYNGHSVPCETQGTPRTKLYCYVKQYFKAEPENFRRATLYYGPDSIPYKLYVGFPEIQEFTTVNSSTGGIIKFEGKNMPSMDQLSIKVGNTLCNVTTYAVNSGIGLGTCLLPPFSKSMGDIGTRKQFIKVRVSDPKNPSVYYESPAEVYVDVYSDILDCPNSDLVTCSGNGKCGDESTCICYEGFTGSGCNILESIREIDIFGSMIQFVDLQDKQMIWNFTIINETTYSISKVLNENGTTIRIQIQSFLNDSFYEFASKKFFAPSNTIKYTIYIDNWIFKSSLNILQVIFSSGLKNSVQPVASSCVSAVQSKFSVDDSSKENISTNNTNNIYSDPVEVSNGTPSIPITTTLVNFNGLYISSRFANKAIVDGKIITIQNDIFSNNQSSSTKFHVTLPYFQSNIIIDPDFSVVIGKDYKNIPDPTPSPGNCDVDSGKDKNQNHFQRNLSIIVVFSALGVSLVLGAIIFITLQYKNRKSIRKLTQLAALANEPAITLKQQNSKTKLISP